MPAWADTFERPSGPLGNTPQGLPWRLERGSVAVRDGKYGAAQQGDPGAFATIDSGSSGADGTLVLTFPPSAAAGEPVGLYFRVTDVNNYLAAILQTGTVTRADGDIDTTHRVALLRFRDGVRTQLGVTAFSENVPVSLTVAFDGPAITATLLTTVPAGNPAPLARSDSHNVTATRHGFGSDSVGSSTIRLSPFGMADAVSFTPLRAGSGPSMIL